jgi:hypothetical protein
VNVRKKPCIGGKRFILAFHPKIKFLIFIHHMKNCIFHFNKNIEYWNAAKKISQARMIGPYVVRQVTHRFLIWEDIHDMGKDL